MPQGYVKFSAGEVLSSTDEQRIMDQALLSYASATARDAAVTSALEGQFCYLQDTDALTYYDGSAWQQFGSSPDSANNVIAIQLFA